jgi:hypothetical protein
MKKFTMIGILVLFGIAFLNVNLETVFAQPLGVWIARGSHPQFYDMGGDPTASHGSANGGYIRSNASQINGFGTWMIYIRANQYLGKRVRLSAYVITENVLNWAALWIRVDGYVNQTYTQLSFDNMYDRPIIGTNDWKKYELVLDVPSNSAYIFYGILLDGTGEARVDGLELEVVSNDVPVTDLNDFFTYLDYYKEGKYKEVISRIEWLFESTPIPESHIYVYDHVIYYLSLYRDGQVEKAKQHILDYSMTLDERWIAPVVHFYAGKISEDSLMNAAEDADQQIDKEQKCEAYYYAGMKHLFEGDTTKARARFEACIATGISYYLEYEWAEIELDRLNQPTGVKEIVNTSIEDFELLQNYPNPFNPRTTISYSIPQSGFVELRIYNMLGREIQTVVNEFQQAGRYNFDFDANKLSNGVYYYQLKVGNHYSETKKMLYIK